MGARTDFWLAVSDLATQLEREGATSDERIASVIVAWASMPETTKQAVDRQLKFLIDELSRIEAEMLFAEMRRITAERESRSAKADESATSDLAEDPRD
jgi:hypothetical protein